MNIQKLFSTIDTHVAGEPFRIINNSPMSLDANIMDLNQELIEQSFNREKKLLLNEPRGYQGMNGCIVLPSKTADYACLFVNHDNDPSFTYSGLVATVTALLETGNLAKKESNHYEVETIYGVYSIHAAYEQQEVPVTRFESNKCRVIETNETYKNVQIDNARNYLVYSLPKSIPRIAMENLSALSKWGRQTVLEMENTLEFDGLIITEPVRLQSHMEVRSITFKKDGIILRSPGPDSTFAIFTSNLHEKCDITTLTNHSIFGSSLTASLISGADNRFSMETRGFVTGVHQFIYDQKDPLQDGFLLK